MARRSIASSELSVGAPCTWQRNPSSLYFSARTTPDLASRRLAKTSWVLLPMDETMPIPVTTTRLMIASSAFCTARPGHLRSGFVGHHCVSAQHANFDVEGTVDDRSVRRQPAVGNSEHQLRTHDPFDVDAVHDLLDGRKNLTGKLHFT